jgi:hypothetical protein
VALLLQHEFEASGVHLPTQDRDEVPQHTPTSSCLSLYIITTGQGPGIQPSFGDQGVRGTVLWCAHLAPLLLCAMCC